MSKYVTKIAGLAKTRLFQSALAFFTLLNL